MEIYLIAFLVGGFICGLGQLLLDYTDLTPAHLIVSFTVLGTILGGLGIYDSLIEFAGGGAVIPVIGFGSSIVSGAISEAQRMGFIGIFTGVFELTGLGLASAIFFSFLIALVFSPKK